MDRNSERFHFEITGDPYNLIGSQKFDLISSFYFFFALNRIFFLTKEKAF